MFPLMDSLEKNCENKHQADEKNKTMLDKEYENDYICVVACATDI